MRYVVIGANGQLGKDVCYTIRKNDIQCLPLNHEQIEISERESVIDVLGDLECDVVINTAAMHDVEACETEPEKAFKVNGIGARNLATAASMFNFRLVSVSTDYIFDGKKNSPYIETDSALPLNSYGNTKLAGEYYIRSSTKKFFIVRTSALYGESPCRAKGGLNFVNLMLKLAEENKRIRVVDDEIISPTHTLDVARQIVAIAMTDNYGVYHATSNGCCSWYQFAEKVFAVANIDVDLCVAEPGSFAGKACRPKYSVLDNRRLREDGLDLMPDWEDGVRRYLRSIGI